MGGMISFLIALCPFVAMLPEDRADDVPVKSQISSSSVQIRSFESHGPYCGIYSILAAAASFGKSVDVASLWVPEVVSAETGSNAANLLYGLRSVGLDGTCHSGLSWLDLTENENPMILHYRSAISGQEFDHWVTLLGSNNNGKLIIYDPPFPAVETEPSMVLAKWDGFAVEVHPLGRPSLNPYLWQVMALGLFFVSVWIFTIVKSYVLSEQSLLAQACIVLVVIVSGSVLLHRILRIGLLNSSISVAAVQDRYFGTDFKEIGIEELDSKSRQGVVLVDARRATSFKNGSIRNAIDVPVDSSLAHREEVLAKINRNEEIVVFCQSENCEYSDKIARFLKFNGFKKVQIYRNGIREWEDKKVVNDRS